jgi:hypothetical protein
MQTVTIALMGRICNFQNNYLLALVNRLFATHKNNARSLLQAGGRGFNT